MMDALEDNLIVDDFITKLEQELSARNPAIIPATREDMFANQVDWKAVITQNFYGDSQSLPHIPPCDREGNTLVVPLI